MILFNTLLAKIERKDKWFTLSNGYCLLATPEQHDAYVNSHLLPQIWPILILWNIREVSKDDHYGSFSCFENHSNQILLTQIRLYLVDHSRSSPLVHYFHLKLINLHSTHHFTKNRHLTSVIQII